VQHDVLATRGRDSMARGSKRAKRRKGEGSLFQRKDGRWVARIYLENGKTKERLRRTEKEAIEALTRLRSEALDGTLAMTQGLTVAAFLGQWLEMKSREVKLNTQRSYEGTVRLYVNPQVGRIRLERLSALDVSRMVGEVLKTHSASSAAYSLRVLKMALKQAVLWGMLPRNVAEAVKAPRVERAEMKVWSPAEASRFLDQTRLHRLYALFYLALTTGMRRGELLGLHWESVDLERARLRVKHNLIDAKGGLRLETPKTRGSRRSIALPPDVVQVLEEHRGRMKGERRAREAKLRSWPSPQLVFVSEEGTALDPSNVTKSFRLLCEQAGVPSIRLHDLRHTAATLLIRRAVPAKLVADRLGHTDPGFTLRVYTHVFDEHREESALSLGDLLGVTSTAQAEGAGLAN
jgi:integrase